MINKFDSFISKIPLTLRGLLALLMSLYFAFVPAHNEADLVAATIGFCFLTVLTIMVLMVVITALFVKRTLAISLLSPPSSPAPGHVINLGIRVSKIFLAPLLCLRLRVEFEHPGTVAEAIEVRGWIRPNSAIAFKACFPHRGDWKITHVSVEVRDILGLARCRWLSGLNFGSISVYPLKREIENLPIISSSFREGEMLTDRANQSGEPFDIKTYHHSDGMRKILWKLFAKSGELMARHPEPSMTPEGKVVLYVVADVEDDQLCSFAHAYCNIVSKQNLDLIVGVDGAQGKTETTPDNAFKLMVESVWTSGANLNKDFEDFLHFTTAKNSTSKITKVGLLFSSRRISGNEGLRLLRDFGQALNRFNISPILLIDRNIGFQEYAGESGLARQISRFFLNTNTAHPQYDYHNYQRALSYCAQQAWEVLA